MELKRDQIIKGLECCYSNNACDGCPKSSLVDCRRDLERDALALIKELDYVNRTYKDLLCQLNARIYELQLELETAKGQVINKFAERVKKYYSTLSGNTNSNLVAYHIDQIAKEMLEGG